MGTAGMGESAERGLTLAGSAEPWWWGSGSGAWPSGPPQGHLTWAGRTQRSQRKSVNALVIAKLPQVNPSVERTGMRVDEIPNTWIKLSL